MGHAAFNFNRGQLSNTVELGATADETTVIEIPSRFTADSANVGRVMFRVQPIAGQTRAGALVKLYNSAENGQVVRQASIATNTGLALTPPTSTIGGITMTTVGGVRATAEPLDGQHCIVECLIDPSTGGIPNPRPYTLRANITNGTSREFGPAPMDAGEVTILLDAGLAGNIDISWLDNLGGVVCTSAFGGAGQILRTFPVPGGLHLRLDNTGPNTAAAIVTWS